MNSVRDLQRNHRRRKRILLTKYLQENPCTMCGESDIRCLEFDHRSDKYKNVSEMTRSGYSWKSMQLEISKCDVLCSNCHRKKTIGEPPWFKDLATFENEVQSERKILTEKHKIKSEIRHGSKTGYSYHKCRCDTCREAHRVREKKYRMSLRTGSVS